MSKRGEAPHAISVKKQTYELLEREAERRGIAVSSLVEEGLAWMLGTTPPPVRKFRNRKRRN